MNEFSHLIMSLSYAPTDPRIPDALRKAAARIVELEREKAAALGLVNGHALVVQQLEARIEELEGALQPFAKWKIADNAADHLIFRIEVKVGDLRNASAALASGKDTHVTRNPTKEEHDILTSALLAGAEDVTDE